MQRHPSLPPGVTFGKSSVARPFAKMTLATPEMGVEADILISRQVLCDAARAVIIAERGVRWFIKLLAKHKAERLSGLSDAVLIGVLRDAQHCRATPRRQTVH